jgi:PilZ domain
VASLLHRFEAGLNLLGRRTEPRYEASGLVEVYDGGPRGALLASGCLRNISASGACIATQERLAFGHLVHLTGRSIASNAIVRHTAAGCEGFIIGREFVSATVSSDRDPSGLPAAW